jgi:hypothetical protein
VKSISVVVARSSGYIPRPLHLLRPVALIHEDALP